MKKTALFLLAAPLALLAVPAGASEPPVIFVDEFNDLSQWSGPNNNNTEEGRIIEVTDENSEAIFGEAGNSYLRLFKETNLSVSNAISANGAFSEPSPVVTVSFDFWNASWGAGQIVLRPAGPSTSNANRIHEIAFARGSLCGVAGVYQANQTQRIEIVLNNSTETVYYADHYSVASDTFDVWVDGVRMVNNHTYSRGTLPIGAPLASLQFATFTGSWGELLVDNLVVHSGAHVTPASETPAPAFSETFDDLSAWLSPTNQLEGHREIGITTENSETYFGEATNSYLRFYKNDPEGDVTSTQITASNVSSSTVVTVSFDFWQDTTEGLLNGFAFRAGRGTSVPNASRVHSITLRNGALNDRPGIYDPDALNNIQIVYNNSSEPVTYLGGERTLIADAMDVWMNGVLVLPNEQFLRGTLPVDDPLSSYQFVGFANDRTETFIDNFKVYNMPLVVGDLTIPTLPVPTITDLQHNDYEFNLSFTTETGYTYTVEYTDDLTSGNWSLVDARAGTGDVITVWDWYVQGRPARFYRVTVSAD